MSQTSIEDTKQAELRGFQDTVDFARSASKSAYDVLNDSDEFSWKAGFGGIAVFEHDEKQNTVFVQEDGPVLVSRTDFDRAVEYLNSKSEDKRTKTDS